MTASLTANLTAVFNKAKAAEKRAEALHLARLQTLKENIDSARDEIRSAIENFNNVTEPKLIDLYIYKIQSEQSRFEQLLSEYKTLARTPIDYNEAKSS
ncbi:MAG: DUF2508 family protein [Ruminococcaceae bacterium]|nr:DUF2508 family protein [Oscillospiraceae bacterium]